MASIRSADGDGRSRIAGATAVAGTSSGVRSSGSTRRTSCATLPCQANRSVTTVDDSRRALGDIRFSRAGAGADDTFFLQLACDGDDLLVRLLHFAESDGAQDFHLLLH